ncbi:hypothetical protein BB561_001848 [Smittium simulii]|uniref:Cytochrome P450 n=1 Tax=Smittium simulii TaxID=133385 RepID=A0A2T9YSQ2_9FUNG|nr:hypothetical protein BB561_001848 [Smittium simulii]
MSTVIIVQLVHTVIAAATAVKTWATLGSAFVIYKSLNLYFFGPLRHIPGPWWSRFTYIPYEITGFRGLIDTYGAKLHAKYGPVVRIGPTQVSIARNDDIRNILASYKHPKSKVYEINIVGVPDIFSTTDKELNKKRRKQVGPAFSQTGLDSVEDLVLQVGILSLKKKLDNEIRKAKGHYLFNYYSLFQSSALDIIGELTLGKSFNAVEGGGHPIIEWIKSSIKLSVFKMISPGLLSVPFFFKKFKKDKKKLIQYTADAINSRKELISNNQYNVDRIDILQMYITAVNSNGSKLTEEEVMAEIIIMILAGADTTSITMSWLLHFYTLYPQVHKKVVEEINQHFPNKEQPIRYKEAQEKLVYFMATVYECMRLKPAVSGALPRESSSDGVKLLQDQIPADIQLTLFIEGGNQDPSVWESPRQYIPERFLTENGETLSKKLITFSSGVRICPGKK